MTARDMVAAVGQATKGWAYDVVSVGFPGPVVGGRCAAEPANLGKGWVGFDFAKAFGKPVRVVNDAAMQALGAYRGARMLFLGLGTGLGSALVVEGVLVPLELAHLPYRKGKSFEDFVGSRAQDRLGKRRWRKHVHAVVGILRHAMQAPQVVLGGGGVKDLVELPPGARRGTNAHAIVGGLRLWETADATNRPPTPRTKA
jgi:polyphosphate glucokinase